MSDDSLLFDYKVVEASGKRLFNGRTETTNCDNVFERLDNARRLSNDAIGARGKRAILFRIFVRTLVTSKRSTALRGDGLRTEVVTSHKALVSAVHLSFLF